MKDTFDKVLMDEETKTQMRNALINPQRKAKRTRLAPVIGIVAALALIMIIPNTRTMVVNAAAKVAEMFSFTTNNGNKVTLYEEEEQIDAEVELADPNKDYAQVKDGRLYFVLDGEWTDITDQCSDTEAFRYEIKNDDGSREVILIGGTPELFGWWSLNFDATGKYIWNMGSIPAEMCEHGDPLWLQERCKEEGIPYDDGNYDYEYQAS